MLTFCLTAVGAVDFGEQLPPYHLPGNKAPFGNGPGASRPTRYACCLPEAKDGYALHVETGQFVQDEQSMPFGGPHEDDYTHRLSHDGLLTINDQVTVRLSKN